MDDNNTEISISGEVSGGGDAGTPTTSRWNPTKEQISVLEGLYGQGIRTPSAEQIQQITSRLRAYGHIEGKNVFYWFQNHKARQRQKQKQESMVYINRFPILPSCTNVLCSPFCVPQGGVGMYPQFQKVMLPGGVKRRSKAEKVEKIQEGGSDRNRTGHLQPEFSNSDQFHETLQLFPLHPTGILEGKSENCYSSSSVSTVGSSNLSTEKSIDQPFFNFFGEHGSCEGE